MAKQCPPTVDQQQLRNIHNVAKSDIFKAYMSVFSTDQGLNDRAIDDLKDLLKQRKYELGTIEKQIPGAPFMHKGKLKTRKAKLQQSIKELKLKIEDNKGKPEILQRLENLIVGHVLELFDQQNLQGLGFQVKPELLFNVMKESIITPRTFPKFKKLSDLSKGDLLSVERQFKRDFKKLKKHSKSLSQDNGKPGKGYKLSWWQDEVMHPLAVSRRLDPTGNSFKPVESSLKLAENAYSSRANHEEALTTINNTILDLVNGDKASGGHYLYLMDTISKIGPGDKAQSAENIYRTLHELGDGEKVRIVPTTIVNVGEGGKIQFSDEFYKKDPITGKSDQEIWTNLVKANVKNKINMSGWIQKYEHKVGTKTKTHYYVMIKKIDPNTNAEYYRAYEAPYKVINGNDILQFPPTSGAKSVEFYRDWYRRKKASETIGGIRTFDPRTKTWIVEEGVMKAGWYKTTGRANVRGNKGTKKEFIAQTYKDYKWDDEFNNWESKIEGTSLRDNSSFGIHHDVWKSLADLREMFTNVANDISESNKVFEEKLLNILPENITNFGKADINGMLKEAKYGIDVDVLDMNIAVRGEGENRTIYTPNTQFSELFNYMPYMYNDVDLITNLLKARENAKRTLGELQRELASIANSAEPDDIKKMTPLKNQIKEASQVVEWHEDTVRRKLGLGTTGSTFNQVTAIKAAKHRSEHSNPLKVDAPVMINGKPQMRTVNYGRRKDARVFHDYLQNTFTSIEQNKLKLDLLESVVNGMPPAIKDYTIDQVKAALGREDSNAGLFRINYSDERWGLNENEIGYLLNLNNKLISANLLKGTSTSMTNNFQSIGYSVISDLRTMKDARAWRIANPKEAADAAAYAGITDEMQTIADGLIGGALSSGGQEHWFSGFWNKAIMGMLIGENTKHAFVTKVLGGKGKASKWWTELADWLIRGRVEAGTLDLKGSLDEQAQILYAARAEVLEDTFELTRGLAELDNNGNIISVLTPKESKALAKVTKRTFPESHITNHLKWALGGGAFSRILQKYAGGESLWSFSKGEVAMRTESLYIAAEILKNTGDIDRNLQGTNLYKNPKVIAHARLLTNNVMFSMSQANLPKMFRGIIGRALWKFKPYTWNQMGTEYNIIQAFYDEKLNKHRKESNIRGAIMGIIMKPKSEAERQMRQLLLNRGIPTLITTTGMKIIPGMKSLSYIMRKTVGMKGYNAIGRGAEFQILKAGLSTGLSGLMLGLRGMSLTDDEEERVYEDWRRHFLPMIINILWDTFTGKDPWSFARIYSRGFHNSLEKGRYLIKQFDSGLD